MRKIRIAQSGGIPRAAGFVAHSLVLAVAFSLSSALAARAQGVPSPTFGGSSRAHGDHDRDHNKWERDRDHSLSPSEKQARDLLRRMVKAEMTRAFFARETTFSADGKNSEQLVKRDPKRGLRRETIKPDKGDVLVDDYHKSWFYSPRAQRLIERGSLLSQGEPDKLFKRIGGGGGRLRAVVAGSDTVAGRVADIVSVSPPAGVAAPSRRFWVDRETGLRLRSEEIGPTGQVLFGSAYVFIDLSPRFKSDDFTEPQATKGVEIVHSTRRNFPTVEAAQKAGVPVHTPTFLPSGFSLKGVSTSGSDNERVSLRYDNGLTVLTLAQSSRPLPKSAQDRLGPSGSGFIPLPRGQRGYVWRKADRTFFLFGALPDDQMKRIADSVW